MAKVTKEQQEADEKLILNLLKTNGNKSPNHLAEKTKFSRQKVWRIISRLEENNTILGYHAVIDNTKINLKKYIISLKTKAKPMTEKMLNSLKWKLLKELNVTTDSLHYTHGSSDWLLTIMAPDIKSIIKTCHILEYLFEGYLKDIQITEVLFTVYDNGFINPKIDELDEFFNIDKKL